MCMARSCSGLCGVAGGVFGGGGDVWPLLLRGLCISAGLHSRSVNLPASKRCGTRDFAALLGGHALRPLDPSSPAQRREQVRLGTLHHRVRYTARPADMDLGRR
jgi:hypothetical protein